MNCSNCNTPNADGEQFCAACGSELTSAVPAPPTASAPTAVPPPAPTMPAVATLTCDGCEFPLFEGKKFIIARDDTEKCSPDLPLASPDSKVSSAPVEISVENGKTKITVDPRGITILVGKLLHPGDSIDLRPGDMIVLAQYKIGVS